MRINVCLYGKHSNRTPLAYAPYKKQLINRIAFTPNPLEADILVTGFSKDYADGIGEVNRILDSSPNCKLTVISEEPFWDSIYAHQYQDSIVSNLCRLRAESDAHFLYQAHHNSSLYDYASVPYFITTDPRYIIRYIALISSWLSLPQHERKHLFIERHKPFALLAEKRISPWYHFSDTNTGLEGLCIPRSEIGIAMASYGYISGKGFSGLGSTRQSMPDWHLDKLAKCNRKFTVLSAIENTYHKWYVTEKIFDAYACCCLPLYYAKEESSVYSVLGIKSFMNMHTLDSAEIVKTIINYEWSADSIEAYEYDAAVILEKLKDINGINQDISLRSDRIYDVLLKALQIDT